MTDLEQIEQQLKKIESDSEKLRDELNLLDGIARDLKLMYAQLKHGVKPGAIVKSKGKLYRLTKLDVSWHPGKPWVFGNPQKQDGSFGTVVRHIYDENYEIIKP